MSVRIDRIAFAAELTRADLSVNRLAELSGVSRATCTAVKRGKNCSQATADKLTAILGNKIIEKECF